MTSTSTTKEPVSGVCALLDLPLHLLYQITRALDLNSQRNLFLCSSQLYSKWQLHIPDHNCWQFVERSIKLLETATSGKLCDSSSVLLFSVRSQCPGTSGATEWAVTCKTRRQSPLYTLSSVPSRRSNGLHRLSLSSSVQDRLADQVRFGMTKDQLWHRLAGAPDLVSANMLCYSHPELVPASDQMKLFARQTFDLLCTCHGLLTINMKGLEASPNKTAGCHYLRIWHGADRLQGLSVWEIDDERCIVDPPNIEFDDMPEEVTTIMARMYSHTAPRTNDIAYFYPDSQVIHDFAYKGNVDIDAWIEMQHEAANDWYDHMDDFDSMQDLDDM